MKKHEVKVTKRTVFGKQLKKLRREGVIPANIYGKDMESVAVQLPLKTFEDLYKEVGSSGVVEVDLDGDKRPTLIHNLQYDYVNHTPLHADFFQVNLKEKVKTTVPLHVVGEPFAVTEKLGLLLQSVNEVEVEALPTDLPEHVEVEVSQLSEVGQNVTVSDIKKLDGVEILTDPNQVVASIGELVTAEAEEQAAEEAAAAEEAGAEGAEGEVEPTAEGEAPAEETPKEEAKAE